MVDFFQQPQGAAVFKHALLRSYLTPFIQKTGSRSEGSRVAYVDVFAGAGVYDDGSPGSPALALATAQALAEIRQIQCFFVEADQANFLRLSDLIQESGVDDRARAMLGDATDFLSPILESTAEMPLFAFLDPFGLGIPFDDLIGGLCGRTRWANGRRQGPATEILVNFVYASVYRNAAKIHLKTSNPAQVANARAVVAHVNATLGGDWWQIIWTGPGDTIQRVKQIRTEYARRVVAAAGTGWRSYVVSVQDSWDGKPVYDLILFTQHEQGLWVFNEATSLARKAFRNYCGPSAQGELWDHEEEWIPELARNVHSLLKRNSPVRLIEHLDQVYGGTLGFARGTHLRKALTQLHQQGILADKPSGPFEAMVVRRAGEQLPDLTQPQGFF